MLKKLNILLQDPYKEGFLKVTIGAALISFSGVYVKIAHVGPSVAGFYRNLIGGIILLIIVLLKGQKIWVNLLCFSLECLCGILIAIDLFVWHKSIHFIGPGLATILPNFQVFLLALIEFFIYKEKLSFHLIMAIPLAILGLFMIVGVEWNNLRPNYRLGVVLGFSAAFCYAFFMFILRKIQSSKYYPSPMSILVVISFVSTILLGFAAIFQGENLRIPDIQSYIALFSYGIFSQVLGWVLITTGLPRLKISIAGLLLLLQPSLAFIWDMVFFKRETDLLDIIGAAIALIAIYIGSLGKIRD